MCCWNKEISYSCVHINDLSILLKRIKLRNFDFAEGVSGVNMVGLNGLKSFFQHKQFLDSVIHTVKVLLSLLA